MPMLSMERHYHYSVIVVIYSFSSSPSSWENPQNFDSWRCSCTALIYYITPFSLLVASPGEEKGLLCTANRVTVLIHVTSACVFVVMAARFCSHSTVWVYVDVIHYLQTLEPIPCAAVCTRAASL